MRKKNVIFIVLTNLFFLTSLFSDQFPFHPKHEITLLPGLGSLHHPVTTKNPEAQKYFDQGLTLIFAFNHDAAYWSFQKASQLDPSMAMAYWGMALAVGPNINMSIPWDQEIVAYDSIQKALQLSTNASENERDYIQALAARYTNDHQANLKQLASNYKNKMELLTNKYPDDLDAATLYAESAMDLSPWGLWTSEGEPKKGTLEIVQALESVLKRDPLHLGANHYYIHAIEASKHPERALLSANRLQNMLPGSGHILHMPGHIYLLVGDYHTAAICNEKAVQADKAYIEQFGLDGIYPLHYMSHNLYFLSRAYAMEGQFEKSMKAAKELEDFYKPHNEEMPSLEYYIPTPFFVMLRFHRWKDVLNFPEPNQKLQVTNLLWHYGQAIALAEAGELQKAQREQQFFLENVKKVSPEAIYGYNKAQTILKIAENLLFAKVAEKQKEFPVAIEALKKSIEIQDTMNYNEPPDWFFPIRESLGMLLLDLQRPKEAEQVFREDLDKHPRNGRALYGLLQALKSQGRTTDAYWVQMAFNKAWQYSDSPPFAD